MVLFRLTVLTIHTTTLWYSKMKSRGSVWKNKIWDLNATVIYFLYFRRSTFTFAANSWSFACKGIIIIYFFKISKLGVLSLIYFNFFSPFLKGLDSTSIMICTVVTLCSSSPADLKIRKSWRSFHLTAKCPPPLRRLCTWTFSLLGDAASSALTETDQMLKHTHTQSLFIQFWKCTALCMENKFDPTDFEMAQKALFSSLINTFAYSKYKYAQFMHE